MAAALMTNIIGYLFIYVVVSLLVITVVFRATKKLERETKITLRCAAIALFWSPSAIPAGYFLIPVPSMFSIVFSIYALFADEVMFSRSGMLTVALVPYIIFLATFVLLYILIERLARRRPHDKNMYSGQGHT